MKEVDCLDVEACDAYLTIFNVNNNKAKNMSWSPRIVEVTKVYFLEYPKVLMSILACMGTML